MLSRIHFWVPFIAPVDVFTIYAPADFTGRNFLCTATLNGTQVNNANWSIISGNQYATINQYGRVDLLDDGSGQAHTIIVQATYGNNTDRANIIVTYAQEQLTIQCADTITGVNGNVFAVYNGQIVGDAQWSIITGQEYATIDPGSGNIDILSSGQITIQAEYQGQYGPLSATKVVNLVYNSNTSTETTVDPDTGQTTTTTTETTTDPETGATTTTEYTVVTNEDGSSSQTNSETTTNTDGSSSSTSTTTNADGSSSETQSNTSAPDPTTGSTTTNSTTTNYDENGDTTGSNTTDITNNTDGSYSSTSTNYNADGDPTDTTNQDRDSEGNVDTQDIVYDAQGNSTVTGYTIDTSGNPSGTKDITGDGVDTEFMPWDNSDGWEMHIRFKSNQLDQPNPPLVVDTEDTGANYHFTIVCSKSPYKPWPGFHIRWTLNKTNYSSGNIVLGYTPSGSASTNRNLAKAKTTGANAYTYDFTISYDPTLKKYPSKFRCVDNLNGGATQSFNYNFDPINYDLTLGYNINQQGQPYRYSNVEILEFSVNKL